jgi:hypothetical protein
MPSACPRNLQVNPEGLLMVAGGFNPRHSGALAFGSLFLKDPLDPIFPAAARHTGKLGQS